MHLSLSRLGLPRDFPFARAEKAPFSRRERTRRDGRPGEKLSFRCFAHRHNVDPASIGKFGGSQVRLSGEQVVRKIV